MIHTRDKDQQDAQFSFIFQLNYLRHVSNK